jgi:hypothetical protein
MNRLPVKPSQAWAYDLMGDHQFRHPHRWLAWWYHLAAPLPAGPEATYRQRARVQRGYTASLIYLSLFPIMIGVFFIGVTGPNTQIGWTALAVTGVIVGCVTMNRLGWVTRAGGLLALAINFGMYLSLLRAPGGLSPNDKDIFYLLIFSELIIGAILPPLWIFPAMGLNLVFSWLMLTVGPHTPALDALLQTSLFPILMRIVQLHTISGVIVFALAMTTRQSIDRANLSEHIAHYERDAAQRQKQEADRAWDLANNVQAISATLASVSNGDLSARVPLVAGATLWHIARPINTLLKRLQQAQEMERRLQVLEAQQGMMREKEAQWSRLLKEVSSSVQEIETASLQGRPLRLIPGQTPLDLLQRALHGRMLVAHRSEGSPPSRLSQ